MEKKSILMWFDMLESVVEPFGLNLRLKFFFLIETLNVLAFNASCIKMLVY